MNSEAPALLVALEQSGLGAAIRQSIWAYPAANTGHIIALVVFAGAVTVMDLRLLGAFSATKPADIVVPAQRTAIAALLAMAATGSVLFTAEASHVSLNLVFLSKMILVATGIANALLVQRLLAQALAETPAQVALPSRVRCAAALSLSIWIMVAAAGRLIAYF